MRKAYCRAVSMMSRIGFLGINFNSIRVKLNWSALVRKKQLSNHTFSSLRLGNNVIRWSNVAKNLGVLLGENLSITNHFSWVVSQSFYELWQIGTGTVISLLSVEAATALVHSFIGTILDYCNSLLYLITETQLSQLQSVQNAAAWLITTTPLWTHINRFWDHCTGFLWNREFFIKLTL